MTMALTTGHAGSGNSFAALVSNLRPNLHRYCARLVGSVIDGEDVVQEALVKAFEAFDETRTIENQEAWVFRIAHNTAMDLLRHRARHAVVDSHEDLDMFTAPMSDPEKRQVAAVSLRTLIRLPVTQRSSIILMEILGYSLEEVRLITGSSVPAIKTAIHRGRARLQEIASEPDDLPPPSMTEPERSLLTGYIDRFNAHDFDAVRDMLADEVRLDLVGREKRQGRKKVATYFENYNASHNCRFVPGFVERRPAIIVRNLKDPSGSPAYFILLKWADDRVVNIRDFVHARYALDGADLLPLC